MTRSMRRERNRGRELELFHRESARNVGERRGPDQLLIDTVITGNVIETVKGTAIAAGWGPSLRDVTITGNLVRSADVGIAVSVVQEAGTVVIANNLIADTPSGAIVGREWDKTVTGDLSKEGAERYVQLTIDGNRVR